MYERVKELLLPILKVEDKQPAPLPGHSEREVIRIIRASSSYLAYRLFFWKLYAVLWAAAVVIVSAALLAVSFWFVLLIVPLVAFAVFKASMLYVATRLDYEMRWYVLTERSLLIREGAWVVREVCLTFANAQNVRVTQGPLQRLFGFWNIEISTAGGGSKSEEQGGQTHRARLNGLDDPGPIRDLILDLLRHQRGAGLGDPDDREHDEKPPLNPILLNEVWQESKKLRLALQ
jgi:membrane protein YdbS with pleckstrin-like domain